MTHGPFEDLLDIEDIDTWPDQPKRRRKQAAPQFHCFERLPIAAQAKVLRYVQWSARATCRLFLRGIDAVRPSLSLRWPRDRIEGLAEVHALLSRLPQLRELDASEGHSGTASTKLRDVLSLRQLGFSRWLHDLAPLTACTALCVVNLRGCYRITHLGPLAGCSATLHTLTLAFCTGLSDVRVLAWLPALRELSLASCAGLSDIAPLADCRSLASLNLSSCTAVADWRPLASCLSLHELNLTSCTTLSAVDFLPTFPCLKLLYLSGCFGIRSAAPLTHCTRLDSLSLDHIPGLCGTGFLGAPSLRALDLHFCPRLTHIASMPTACPALHWLDLSRCTLLTNLDPLSACASLCELLLRDNPQLTDVDVLASCPALHTLNLNRCNRLLSVGQLANSLTLLSLQLWGCSRITDLDFLQEASPWLRMEWGPSAVPC